MRLLIESRNRWTVELTSSKHSTEDCSTRLRANTLVSSNSNPNGDERFHRTNTAFSESTTDYARELNATNCQSTEPSRRKSIHRRIGRFLLRVSKMCPNTSSNPCAYQYGYTTSELPAGGSPVEGSTCLQEMPGSYPREAICELGEPWQDQYSTNNTLYAREHLQGYYKSNQNAVFRRPAPVMTPQLPRLEVPISSHRVPQLMPDQSSVTPPSISPITPVWNANIGARQHLNLQSYLDTVSPCTMSKETQWHPYHALNYPTTPLTTGSGGSSHSSTPLSAHPSSVHSSFDSWSQLKTEQLPPAYSQTYLPLDYDLGTNHTTSHQTSAWQSTEEAQPYHYHGPSLAAHSHTPRDPGQHNRLLHEQPYLSEKSLYEPRAQPPATHPHTDITQPDHARNDVPPIYSPQVTGPQPTINPRLRHSPVVCQHCGSTFTGKYGPGNLKRHVRQTHETVLDRAINKCKVCLKTYNRADALRKHSWKKHRQADAKPNKRRR